MTSEDTWSATLALIPVCRHFGQEPGGREAFNQNWKPQGIWHRMVHHLYLEPSHEEFPSADNLESVERVHASLQGTRSQSQFKVTASWESFGA